MRLEAPNQDEIQEPSLDETLEQIQEWMREFQEFQEYQEYQKMMVELREAIAGTAWVAFQAPFADIHKDSSRSTCLEGSCSTGSPCCNFPCGRGESWESFDGDSVGGFAACGEECGDYWSYFCTFWVRRWCGGLAAMPVGLCLVRRSWQSYY